MSLSLDRTLNGSPGSPASKLLTPRRTTAQGQLNGIFELIEQMQAVDTDGRRADGPRARTWCSACARTGSPKPTSTQLYQAIAPQVEDGLYLVPKVIE